MIVLATAGFDQASAKPPVDTYNNEAINYAKSAIQKIEAGTKSTTEAYGVLGYSYKNADVKEFSTTEGAKSNALGWMNYIIGYIDYYRLGKKDEGLAYLYKASNINSTAKTNPALYQTLAAHYRDDVVRLGNEIVEKLKANENIPTDETKALIAMQKGYADRAADAYARAYNVADKSAAGKNYRDSLYTSLKEIYNLRYEGKKTDVDAFAASVASQPLPNPATTVTPIAEEDPATTTSQVTPVTTPTTTMAKPATTTTKPATTTTTKPPAKPMSSNTQEPATKVTVTKTNDETSASAVKSKTPAKKPVAKKKGSR